MERVVERSNLRLPYQRAGSRRGRQGIDETPVSELKGRLAMHWPSVKQALLEGSYVRQPIRRVGIPTITGEHEHSACRRWWIG